MRCILVSHFHWDREWHRTFEAYRARLVDAVDRVLDLLGADPGYCFVLDGQAVLIEDYLAVRPERRAELERGLREGRLSAGPWYVQPDSLLPSGEAHVRNLLLGRRTVSAFGPVSTVAYVPDSFGHPAQFPQLFAGFGLGAFVYWRGSGDEFDELGPNWNWVAPDGSAVPALLLADGYFNAAGLPEDAEEAAGGLAAIARRGAPAASGAAILMHGFDHTGPERHTAAVAQRFADAGAGSLERGLLESAVAARPRPQKSYRGDLTGARLTSLLPGSWSARMPIKLRNRRGETLLEAWAEPWAALGRRLGLPDEAPALRLAWQSLLQNQAHDSLCGTSLDAVADRIQARFDDAEGIAGETVARILGRLAGLDDARATPWSVEQEIAVFNPSPHPRTDVVRVPLDPSPAMRMRLGFPEIAPLLLASSDAPGFAVDGRPVRVVEADDPQRVRWLPDQKPLDVEFVAADVPAFGCRRFALTPCQRTTEEVDEGRRIGTSEAAAEVADDGTLAVRLGGGGFAGLLGFESRGDRGDSYDFDPVDADPGAELRSVAWRRSRHESGLERLFIDRVFAVPRALDESRERRSAETTELRLSAEVRVAPGVPRVDVLVRLENGARDHRVRLLFPTGRDVARFQAASTFDVVERDAAPRVRANWVHPAPTTFVHQGWVGAHGLTVAAPGLPEAEVTGDGTIAITLLRSVGWLARYDLRRRPLPAGPAMPIPGAQQPGRLEASLSLLPGADAGAARDAELGLRGVLGGARPLLEAGRSLLGVEPATLVLSALKPAENGRGIVVRLLNPTDGDAAAELRCGFPFTSATLVRLDEEPADEPITVAAATVRFAVPAHALRSVLLR